MGQYPRVLNRGPDGLADQRAYLVRSAGAGQEIRYRPIDQTYRRTCGRLSSSACRLQGSDQRPKWSDDPLPKAQGHRETTGYLNDQSGVPVPDVTVKVRQFAWRHRYVLPGSAAGGQPTIVEAVAAGFQRLLQ